SPTGLVAGWLPPRRPSRSVALLYFPYSDASDVVSSGARRLRVAAGVTLDPARRVIRAGGRARFTARLAVAVGRGTSVLGMLQVHTGDGWRTVRRLRFRHGARTLRPVVRFRPGALRTSYRVRLRVPAQRGLPYARGTSRRVVVRIRR
ncbi:MAG: hypothetical protein ACRDLN_17925, partial [Solirubrobacteraceae bacterium]